MSEVIMQTEQDWRGKSNQELKYKTHNEDQISLKAHQSDNVLTHNVIAFLDIKQLISGVVTIICVCIHI